MNIKYEMLAHDTQEVDGKKLYRIRALRDISTDVLAGDMGGYIESEQNLATEGRCWIYDQAHARDQARVFDDAQLRDESQAYEGAWIFNRAKLECDARACGTSRIYLGAWLSGEAFVSGEDHVFDDEWLSTSGSKFAFSTDLLLAEAAA